MLERMQALEVERVAGETGAMVGDPATDPHGAGRCDAPCAVGGVIDVAIARSMTGLDVV